MTNVILVGVIPNIDKEPPTKNFVEQLDERWTSCMNIKSVVSNDIGMCRLSYSGKS